MLAALTVGCGSDPNLNSSNRGASGDNQATSVDNAYIVPTFVPGACELQKGATAQLRFTVTNNRPAKDERLLSVNTDAAERITLPPGATVNIPPGGSLGVGQPAGSSDSVPAVDLTGLGPNVKPATSAAVKFEFKEFGEVTLHVPIEACPVQK